MRLLVVGIGAIGGSLAVRLVQAGHEVVGVARGEHLERVRADGLRLRTPDEDLTVPLEVVGGVGERAAADAEVVLLATKSQDTAVLAGELAASALRDRPVVCAQNGVRNERVVDDAGLRAYGAVVMMPAGHLAPGVVEAYSSPTIGMVDLGAWPQGSDDVAESVAATLRSARVDSRAVPDIMRWKYAKLLMNLGNAAVALCGSAARDGEVAGRADAEGRAVLEAAGIAHASPVEQKERRGDVLHVGSIDGEERAGNSTWQSLARGTGTTEVEDLNGEVVRLGREHGVPTPVNAALTRLTVEATRDGRRPGSHTVEDVLTAASG